MRTKKQLNNKQDCQKYEDLFVDMLERTSHLDLSLNADVNFDFISRVRSFSAKKFSVDTDVLQFFSVDNYSFDMVRVFFYNFVRILSFFAISCGSIGFRCPSGTYLAHFLIFSVKESASHPSRGSAVGDSSKVN